MMNFWKNSIGIMILIKQDISKHDNEGLWEYYLPEVGANEADIKEIENFFGFPLDKYYREFLTYANGWKSFYQSVDLFGTKEICSNSIMTYTNYILNSLEEAVLTNSGFSRDELFPIGSTKDDKDLFVITKHNSKNPGMIIWYAGEEIDRFSNFKDFFLAMTEYNREELKYLKGEE